MDSEWKGKYYTLDGTYDTDIQLTEGGSFHLDPNQPTDYPPAHHSQPK